MSGLRVSWGFELEGSICFKVVLMIACFSGCLALDVHDDMRILPFFGSHGGTGLCKELPPLSASWAVVSCTIHACCPHRCSCSSWGKAQAALPFPKLVLWNQLYCFQAGLGQDCQELHHSAPLWSTCLWRPLTALIGVVAGPQVVVLRVPRDAATGKPHALAEILEQGGVSSILSFAWKQGLELCLQTM